MEAGFGEQQEFSGQKRRKGISGRKNSMYKGRERCGNIWCVLESVGIRVYVWVYGVWGKVGPDCTSH